MSDYIGMAAYKLVIFRGVCGIAKTPTKTMSQPSKSGGVLDECPVLHSNSRDDLELESFLSSVHCLSGDAIPLGEDQNPWDDDWPGYYCKCRLREPPPRGAQQTSSARGGDESAVADLEVNVINTDEQDDEVWSATKT